jgi:hypoxanthine phosphoribosyltransferase
MPSQAALRAIPLEDAIERILVDEQTLQRRIQELGAQIGDFYRGQDLLLISVLKGSIVFMADLIRALSIPHEIDFMATSSYGAAARSSGVVRIPKTSTSPSRGATS